MIFQLKFFLFINLIQTKLIIPVTSSKIIAIIPTACYSHQMFYQQIWRELAQRGHEITIITTDPTNETLANLNEISIKEAYNEGSKEAMKTLVNALINENPMQLIITNRLMELMTDVVVAEMHLPQIQTLIHNSTQRFDLIIAEYYETLHMGFKHKFKCPMIGVIAMDGFPYLHEVMGNPTHAVLYPDVLLPFHTDMSVIERTLAVIFSGVVQLMNWRSRDRINALTREIFGEDTPDVNQLSSEVDMMFINSNPLFSAIRPLSPATINLAGGVHMKKPQQLPEDLQEFLDLSSNGAIYFSLGSNVISKELSFELLRIIMETFSQLPYKVLWKFEDDQLPGKPDNVKITKWTPQQDVLRHPNIKLFITQGGLQSLEEALYLYVPMVVIPFKTDQYSNAAKVEAKTLGLSLDRLSLTVEDFKEAILEVIDNPVYKENVKYFAKQIQDQPMIPLERAIWWIEYVLRHKGAKHLKGPKIPWWQFYYLDVLTILSLLFVLILALKVWILRLICMRIKQIIFKSGIKIKMP